MEKEKKKKIIIIAVVVGIIVILMLSSFLEDSDIGKNWKDSNGTGEESMVPRRASELLNKMREMRDSEIIEILENITDEQMIDIANNPDECLIRYLRHDIDFETPFMLREQWFTGNMGAVSSEEEAIARVKQFAKTVDSYKNCSVEVIGESELLYQLRVQIIDNNNAENAVYRINIFKDSVVTFPGSAPTNYTIEGARFQGIDYATTLKVIDLIMGENLFRYQTDGESSFDYIAYTVEYETGDRGIVTEISLKKTTISVSKLTGAVIGVSTNYIKSGVPVPAPVE